MADPATTTPEGGAIDAQPIISDLTQQLADKALELAMVRTDLGRQLREARLALRDLADAAQAAEPPGGPTGPPDEAHTEERPTPPSRRDRQT